MNRFLQFILVLCYLSITGVCSQTTEKLFGKRRYNPLIPENCYIKYIYDFPFKSTTIYYSDQFPELEIRKYDNTDFILPLFDKIFNENLKVYNPNFWGSVEDLLKSGPPGLIDTNIILLYMHAGWDTAYSISDDNLVTLKPYYTSPDYEDISGLFFFETWFIDPDKGSFEKNVIAYFPIREYWDEYALEEGQAERLRRLILMIYSGLPEGKRRNFRLKNRYKGLNLVYNGIEHEIELFNRPYNEYLYRDYSVTEISDEEYNQWEYHTFDFYKYFDADRFLKVITGLILSGKLHAFDPLDKEKMLTTQDIIHRIGEEALYNTNNTADITKISQATIRYDNLNSVSFNEDWYLDPVTLKMYKKINSITLFRFDYQYDDYTGDFLGVAKTPVITIIY